MYNQWLSDYDLALRNVPLWQFNYVQCDRAGPVVTYNSHLMIRIMSAESHGLLLFDVFWSDRMWQRDDRLLLCVPGQSFPHICKKEQKYASVLVSAALFVLEEQRPLLLCYKCAAQRFCL